MTITTEKPDPATAVLFLSGRLDTNNAPLFEQKIRQWGDEITVLILDLADLEYISSMGLRIFLQTKKESNEKNRKLIIKNMQNSIREVFEITGFLKLMVNEEKFIVIRNNEADDTMVLSFIGEMHSENTEMILKELVNITEEHALSPKSVTVYFDMEKLSHISPGAARLLNEAITQTALPDRTVMARNVSVDMEAALREYGLEQIL